MSIITCVITRQLDESHCEVFKTTCQKNFDVWVSCNYKDLHLILRIDIYDLLVRCNENDQFSNHWSLVTNTNVFSYYLFYFLIYFFIEQLFKHFDIALPCLLYNCLSLFVSLSYLFAVHYLGFSYSFSVWFSPIFYFLLLLNYFTLSILICAFSYNYLLLNVAPSVLLPSFLPYSYHFLIYY